VPHGRLEKIARGALSVPGTSICLRRKATREALGCASERAHAAVTEFLDREGVPYEIVEHERMESTAAEARAVGVPPSDVARTVFSAIRTGHASR
jgi:hypothetical protein